MNDNADPVAETLWSLYVNDERIASGTSSPGGETELAAGRVVADGYVRHRADLHDLTCTPQDGGWTRIDAVVRRDLFEVAQAERAHRAQFGCGILHLISCAGAAEQVVSTDAPAMSELASALRALFDACDLERPGGGVHGAGLVVGGSLHHVSVDVARHAAVERTIGAAFLRDGLPINRGLVVTARISGAMAFAAVRAGIPWVASRSVPTTVAVRIARGAGMTLIARAAGRSPRTFHASQVEAG
jgi:formate dehydrogenase accessory protein FdhD